MDTNKINIAEILKDCPKGTELYSPLFGEVTLYNVSLSGEYPISVRTQTNESVMFSKCGMYYMEYADSECMLFPSKDQRDWSKFKPKKERFNPNTLKPFDRVLVRDYHDDKWVCSIFSHIEPGDSFHYACILELNCKYCIPYNEDTKHLVGTTEGAPEYYRYWED